MGKARAAITIQRPADQVWAVIGRFDDVSWRGDIESCTVEGDIRTVRTVGQPPGVAIQARRYHDDQAKRTLTYGLHAYLGGELIFNLPNGGTFDIRSMMGRHRATLVVTPEGGSACLVTYDVDIEDGYDALLEGTKDGYQASLVRLKRELEG